MKRLQKYLPAAMVLLTCIGGMGGDTQWFVMCHWLPLALFTYLLYSKTEQWAWWVLMWLAIGKSLDEIFPHPDRWHVAAETTYIIATLIRAYYKFYVNAIE